MFTLNQLLLSPKPRTLGNPKTRHNYLRHISRSVYWLGHPMYSVLHNVLYTYKHQSIFHQNTPLQQSDHQWTSQSEPLDGWGSVLLAEVERKGKKRRWRRRRKWRRRRRREKISMVRGGAQRIYNILSCYQQIMIASIISKADWSHLPHPTGPTIITPNELTSPIRTNSSIRMNSIRRMSL